MTGPLSIRLGFIAFLGTRKKAPKMALGEGGGAGKLGGNFKDF
jgi:hypothetical protein